MRTDLVIIPPSHHQIAGANAERMPTRHTTADSDLDLLVVWIKSHADGSPHTRRAYERIGRQFVEALARSGSDLRRATIDHVQAALEVMRMKQDGSPSSPATVNMTIAAVKAFLGFAHQVGYTRFNAAPLIKLRKAPRQLAQRILSEFDTQSILRAAKPGREQLLCEVGYYGALRVSEIASLTWSQVILRDSGEVQLALVGKGDKPRHVLLPADTATALLAMRGDASASARVFPITERMPDSTGFGDYTESGQIIPVRFAGEMGGYVHAMFLDDDPPIAGGRELWGFPKKLAFPSLRVKRDTLLGTLDYGPARIATASMGYKHKAVASETVLQHWASRASCSKSSRMSTESRGFANSFGIGWATSI